MALRPSDDDGFEELSPPSGDGGYEELSPPSGDGGYEELGNTCEDSLDSDAVHYYSNAPMHSSELSFSVSPSSGVPIYRQIIDQVNALVRSGRLKPGDILPSIRKLAESLEVNMMTISKAYSRLEVEGVLVRLRGVGMVIAERDKSISASVKERQAELRPLIEQAVLRGLQLKLSEPQIIAVVESILKENRDE